MASDSLQQFAAVLSEILVPFATNLESSEIDEVQEFVEELGYILPDSTTAFQDLQDAATNLGEALASLDEKLYELETIDEGEEALLAIITLLLASLINFFVRLQQLPDALRSSLPGDYLATTSIDDEIIDRIYAYLISLYLADNYPGASGLLKFFGIIEETDLEQDESIFQPECTLTSFHWQRFGQLLSDPGQIFEEVYGWGTPEINTEKLYGAILELTTLISVPGEIRDSSTETLDALVPGLPSDDDDIDPELWIPLIEVGGLELYIVIQVLPNTSDTEPQAVALSLQINATLEEALPLTESLFLEITASMDLSSGLSAILHPNQGLRIILNTLGDGLGSLVSKGEAALKIVHKKPQDEGVRVFTISENSYLSLSEVYFKSGVAYLPQKDAFDIVLEAGLIGGQFVYRNDASDGFTNNLLSQNAIESNFDLIIGWSKENGVYFEGSASLEIQLPTHLFLGPISINTLYFILGLETSPLRLPLEVSTSISANLGPLQASVERLGVKLDIDVIGSGGELGPFDMALRFKPPNGVGLSIDAGTVKGGGYLFFDSDREEYAGALELVFSEWIALKAIGLITTKMPDGSKGFSLLVIITVEFGSGIQIGFGFTLLGVGGLLGLKRIANVEPLQEGIRTGAVESVMFPQDVVANAPRIISDLRRFFPPHLEIFLVGPMAKIGWGTPPLVSVSLGVILEFPSVTITILGVVKVALPDEKRDILRLQVNFIGRVEPSNQLLWFYAELFDSRVLFLTLEGGMGVLVNWSDNANFVFSVGGFHPRYSPPPLPFPEPPRIAVSILNESWARVRIEGYFAVTSNSVQFGARAELYFGLSAFNLSGHLGFDALFQFNPFFFSFGLSFSLSVKVFGIGFFSVGFSGLLEGPTPWHIKGKGKISLLFFSISVPFEHSWGGSRETILEPIEVFPLLEIEFNALTNWEAVLPKSSNILVSLRKLGETDTEQLVLHPVGKLRISQRKIPVNFKLDKVGNQRPSDVNRLSVDAALPGGGNLSIAKVKEKFAIGQFKDLDDSKRLSSPAFEPLDSGVEIAVAGEQMKTSQATKRVIRYETIIIDNNFKRHVKSFLKFFDSGFALLNDFLFGHFLTGNAVTKSELSLHHKNRLQPFPEVIEIQPTQYSVVYDSNNMPVGVEATTFTSQAEAHEYMEEQIQSDPNLADNLHVIPNTEVELAA